MAMEIGIKNICYKVEKSMKNVDLLSTLGMMRHRNKIHLVQENPRTSFRHRALLCHSLEENNTRESKPLIDSYTKWAHDLCLGCSPLTSIIVSQNMQDLCTRDCDLLPTPF